MPQKQTLFSLFRGLPYHLSIGGVVLNDKNQILVHHFPAGAAAKSECYLLMRETIHEDETILDCLARGLKEEFSISAVASEYIGPVVCELDHETGRRIEKTTLYLLCKDPQDLPEGREAGSMESKSTLEWHTPDELIKVAKHQAETMRADFNELKIYERVKEILECKIVATTSS